MAKFIADDGFRDSKLDHRLPFDIFKLEEILGGSGPDVHKFYNEQWQFLSPILYESVHPWFIDSKIAMPFTKERRLASGGFGTVYKLEIEASHQKIEQKKWAALRLFALFFSSCSDLFGLTALETRLTLKIFHQFVRKEFRPNEIYTKEIYAQRSRCIL
jgi:hypothetical protein